MKVQYFALAALSLAWATSCEKEGNNMPAQHPESQAITLLTSIKGESLTSDPTRAPQLNENGQGNFLDGDTFTLQVSTPSGQNTLFDYEVGSTTLFWQDIALGTEDTQVDFHACYPRQRLNDSKFTFDLETASSKDLLWAHKKGIAAATQAPIELVFEHAMHRLVINFSSTSQPMFDQFNTVCTAKSTCEVDLVAGTLNSDSSAQASFTASGPQAVFLLVPQKTSDVTLRITAGTETKEFPLNTIAPGIDALHGGMQLTVNLTVKDGTLQIDGTTISGWGEQGTVEGEIIM